ncbi:hypothetical protein VP01_4306g1 [Puccinia sorghi]|uniref:Uncharacterized protein n=1 Tax=Puccinia sorghi TaxID=27349 RepID=A0A0L6UQ41_9BASI|nr:hypothetical protein VP01_4306g1 [Puccinia sorghi]
MPLMRNPLGKHSIIAIIEFTPFDQLTLSTKEYLSTFSSSLHQTKIFITQSIIHLEFGPVHYSSRVWVKSFGFSIKNIKLSHIFDFNSHYKQSARLGHIIGNKYNIPSFYDLSNGML